jgi:trigger factor
MKVSSTEVPPRQVALDIEVEQDRLDQAMEQAVRRLAGRVNVPGFRRGKAPRAMVERMVGRDRIVEDALDELLPVVVNEAIEREGVSAYARPRVESIEFNPLRLKATVPLEPKVTLGNYRTDLRVPRDEVRIDAEQVESVVKRLQESHAQWAPVERPVQVGDRVGVDVEARLADGSRTVMDSRDAEYVVDPSGAEPAVGFAEQLVGMSGGDEKTFTLPLPADFADPALANQPAEFTVKLHWVKEKQLPELDESFAQQVGDYPDMAALRREIEQELRTREEERARQELQAAALDKLVEISSVEFPPQVVDHQADHLYETFARGIEQQGLTMDQYLRLVGKKEPELRAEVRAEAETRVRRSLALDAFAAAEGITVDPSDVEAEVGRASAATSEPAAAEAVATASPRAQERAADAVRERKALARLVELATLDTDQKLTSAADAATDTQPQTAQEPA